MKADFASVVITLACCCACAADIETREFQNKNDAVSYYTKSAKDLAAGSASVRGIGRGSVTTTTETRYYSERIAPENYIGSAFSWTQYNRNTCGTVIAWPESEFVLHEAFTYKDSSKPKKIFKGKTVTVAIGISTTTGLSDAARMRVQKNLVESGGNYKDDDGKPIRLPPLNRIIRKRFKFASMKTVYMTQGVMFILLDCDESKDDETVKIAQPQRVM